jgi:hypothetical protein
LPTPIKIAAIAARRMMSRFSRATFNPRLIAGNQALAAGG